ncbi:hypothetical protein [Chengkuizengella sediminis]|uniref:hypothetical protein n=1 Tax=Chengkuizengella sediminis TaxID=1885917 RepID=UPI00138A57EC|nr:hypothetical protein [Chengkuizengella sediminis]NDI35669.1 hypothetical protein [Chengkuizengella sediminis]
MDFQAYDIAIVPIILALVQLAKQLGLGTKLQPVVSLALGIVAGIFYIAPDDPKQAILIGIVMGLAASGLWSGVKNTFQKK